MVTRKEEFIQSHLPGDGGTPLPQSTTLPHTDSIRIFDTKEQGGQETPSLPKARALPPFPVEVKLDFDLLVPTSAYSAHSAELTSNGGSRLRPRPEEVWRRDCLQRKKSTLSSVL